MCESADDFYEDRYLFTQHSLDHGALPCWVTINKNRRGSINFYTTRYLYIKEKKICINANTVGKSLKLIKG